MPTILDSRPPLSSPLCLPWNGAVACLHRWFEAQAAHTPHAPALMVGTETLTYAELNSRANRTAHHLRALGAGPGVLVGVCLEPSPEMAVALLSVLKAGAAYVPLDPGYPAERLAFMIEDAQAAILLTQTPLRAALPSHPCTLALDTDAPLIERQSDDNLIDGATPDDLAYVIYTSGSTGTPKGVEIAHRGVCNNLRWRQEQFPLSHQDRLLQSYSFSFDPSVWAFFWPLIAGAAVVLPRPSDSGDPGRLISIIAREQVSVLGFSPSMLSVLLDHPGMERCRSLRHIFSGGEALSPGLRERFYAVLPHAALYNVYGPTEATIDATWWNCRPGEDGDIVPIGRPLPQTQAYVLSEGGQPVSTGDSGELHIAGVGLARGYLRRPALTAERFVPNPFGPGRLYRTGDLCRQRADGAIEYLGRLDNQVKIRGFRIEIGEIETALLRLPDIKEAAVIAREDRHGNRRLAAYVVPVEHVTGDELASRLGVTLPTHMIPADWVFLSALPLTINGKVDRKALPAPDLAEKRRTTPKTPTATDTQKRLATIWAEVLGADDVGLDDNFFDLGGHSLLAARVASRVYAEFGIDFAVRSLFEMPTLAKLSAYVERRQGTGRRQAVGALTRVPRTGFLLPSFSQQRLWFFEQWQPGTAVYNIPLGLKLTGALDVPAVRASLSEIVRRHESLRTVFEEHNGQPIQKILPPATVSLPVLDLSPLPSVQREDAAQQEAVLEAQRPFDLTHDLMLRARLLRLGEGEHRLILTLHHIASDGWSVGLLLHELNALYGAFAAGQTTPLPEPPAQYADWAAWQRGQSDAVSQKAQMDYWRQSLAGAPGALELPFDRPRPAQQTFQGARLPLKLPAATADSLRTLARAEGATLFMTLVSGLQAVLSRWSGQTDFMIGTPIAGRNRVESEELIGFFVNTLVLRADLSGAPTGREIVRRVRETALGAFSNADLPFERIVDALQPERDPSRHPLFQTLFVLQNAPQTAGQIGELRVETLDIDNGTSKFDLTLNLWEDADSGLSGWWEYNADLFDAATVVRLSSSVGTLLAGLGRDPDVSLSHLPLLTEAERRQVLVEFNRTQRPYPRTATIGDLFSAQADRTPDAEALVWDGGRMTYRELEERSNGLAHHLGGLGVGLGSLVGLFAERSPEMIVALLGILKAGGAYLPLDPSYPEDRLAVMLADARPVVMLAQSHLSARLPQTVPVVALDQEWPQRATAPTSGTQADSLAYVMYTSGSTGRPKAVPIPHRGIIRLVQNTDYASFSPDETFLQLAPISFDASTFEIWGSLLNGARLAIFPSLTPSLEDLGAALKRFGVTTLWLTAGLFILIVDERLDDLRGLRQLLAGGDVLPMPQVYRMRRELPDCRLINGYGPTECTTFACCHTVTDDDLNGGSIPIGGPIANTTAYVLDAAGQPVPVGVTGQLLLGGDGLSPGYLHRPELSAEKFFVNPFAEGRLYRTGDLARWRPNGTLEFLGRVDNQVKIRGFRIELGEIEAALLRLPGVKEAVVTVQGHIPGQKSLAAYIVPAESAPAFSVTALRDSLAARLPGYMVPATFTILSSLPLTPNGKIDRKALPAPVPVPAESHHDAASLPTDAVEAQILALWEELLPNQIIGVHDQFFDVGGHSLLAVRMIHRLEQLTGQKILLSALFEDATIAHLADVIRGETAPAADIPEPMIAFNPQGSKSPFFFLHGDFGGGFFCSDLAQLLGPNQPFYVLPPHGVGGSAIPSTIEEMAKDYLPLLQTVQPQGPYQIGGFCNGGLVAYEMAHQLRDAGERVSLLALVDVDSVNTGSKKLLHSLAHFAARLRRKGPDARLETFIYLQRLILPLDVALKRRLRALRRSFRASSSSAEPRALAEEIQDEYFNVLARYITRRYAGKITLIWSKEGWDMAHGDPIGAWQEVTDEIEYYEVPGSHFDCLTTHAPILADRLLACLKKSAPE